MQHLLKIAFIATVLIAASPGAFADDIKVIANASVVATEISADELKNIFLGTKTSLGESGHVEPVLEKSGPTHEAFLKTYLGKSDSALTTHYRTLVYTGKGAMPKSFASDSDVVAYVAKTKGAIGYVSAAADATGVKTVTVK